MVEVHFVSGSGGIGTRLYNIIKALGGSGGVLVSEGVLIWVATAAAEYDLSFNCAVLNRSRLVFQAILADGRVSGVPVLVAALLLCTVYCCCQAQFIPDDLKKQLRMWDSRFRGVDLSALVPCEFKCPRSEAPKTCCLCW